MRQDSRAGKRLPAPSSCRSRELLQIARAPADRTNSRRPRARRPARTPQSSRRADAHAVSSYRDDNCSFRSTADTCDSTVLTEMYSSAAASL